MDPWIYPQQVTLLERLTISFNLYNRFKLTSALQHVILFKQTTVQDILDYLSYLFDIISLLVGLQMTSYLPRTVYIVYLGILSFLKLFDRNCLLSHSYPTIVY